MARQKGINPLSGSVGDMNYYQSPDGDIARKKAKISKKRLKRGKEFANSRKAGKVFGLASTASRLIRTAFDDMILAGSKSNMNNRMLACIRAAVGGAGTLGQLPFGQLIGFDINENALFTSICTVSPTVEIAEPGKITVSFPPFHPRASLKPPPKTRVTHFRLVAGAALIDCRKKDFKKDVQSTMPLPHKMPVTEPQQLQLSLPVHPDQPLLVAIAIVFGQQVNNEFIDSVNEHHCPVLITHVVYDPPPAPKAPVQKKKAAAVKNKPVKKAKNKPPKKKAAKTKRSTRK